MNESTDLRNRILQMREANNINLGSGKSEYVDRKIIPKENITSEDNVIDHKENFKSIVTNEILTQETDVKDHSLLNKKKSLGIETLSNNSYAEDSINFTNSNEVQFRILATKFNEAVEKAIKKETDIPIDLSNLFDKKEKMTILNNDTKDVKNYILKNI